MFPDHENLSAATAAAPAPDSDPSHNSTPDEVTPAQASASEAAAHKKEFRGWQHWLNPREIPCAVCIPPGARLWLRNIPEHLQRQLGVGAVETVVFTQVSAEACQFRDAVRFRNGREVLLQLLNCRQKVEVLSLCSDDRREEEHQRREEEYRRIFVG